MSIKIIIVVEDEQEANTIKNVIADAEQEGAIDFGFNFQQVESGPLNELLEEEGL